MDSGFEQTQFNNVLKQYLQWTKRTLSEVLNSKAYFVARKALWHTHKADPAVIRDSLNQFVSTSRTTKSGRDVRSDAPRAALIINARRGARGEPGLYGSEMARGVRQLIATRVKSVAFIKSGWIPAIRILGTFARDKGGAAPVDRSAKVYGAEKGAAYPAVEGEQMTSRIVNSATGRSGSGYKALDKYGGAGLELAFYDEAGSMQDYIERKMAEDAARANAQL